MKISIDKIGAVVIIILFAAAFSYSNNFRIVPFLWDRAETIATSQLDSNSLRTQEIELNSSGTLKFVENSIVLLSDDLAVLGDAITTHWNRIVLTPIAVDANNQPVEAKISVEANNQAIETNISVAANNQAVEANISDETDSVTTPPDMDNTDLPGTKNPELARAL